MTTPQPIIERMSFTSSAENPINVPVKFTIYHHDSPIENFFHVHMVPMLEPYTWFIVAEVDIDGMTEQEFFDGPLNIFEGAFWKLHGLTDSHTPILDHLRQRVAERVIEYFAPVDAPASDANDDDTLRSEDNRRVVFNEDGTYDIDDETVYADLDDEADLRRAEHGTPAYEGWDASDEERIMRQIALEAATDAKADSDELETLTNRVANLEALLVDMQKTLLQLERRLAREADFSDWKSSRARDETFG